MCNTSESAIDLILVTQKVCQSGVLNVGISAHLITYCHHHHHAVGREATKTASIT